MNESGSLANQRIYLAFISFDPASLIRFWLYSKIHPFPSQVQTALNHSLWWGPSKCAAQSPSMNRQSLAQDVKAILGWDMTEPSGNQPSLKSWIASLRQENTKSGRSKGHLDHPEFFSTSPKREFVVCKASIWMWWFGALHCRGELKKKYRKKGGAKEQGLSTTAVPKTLIKKEKGRVSPFGKPEAHSGAYLLTSQMTS